MNQRISARTFKYASSIFFFVADVIFSLASLAAAYLIRFEILGTDLPRPTEENYIVLSVLFTALTIYFFMILGLYRPTLGRSRIDTVFVIFKAISISLIILLALSFFYRDFSYSRLITVIGMGLACVLISCERMLLIAFQRSLLRKGIGINRLLIIGTGTGFGNIASRMAGRPEKGYRLVGYLEESPKKSLEGTPLLGTVDEMEQILIMKDINVVVVVLDPEYHSLIQDIVDLCDQHEIDCYLVPDVVELLVGPSSYVDISGVPLIHVKGLRIKGWNSFVKRLMDLIFSIIILILISPLIVIISILIRIDSPGPIFYMQKRVGIDGKIFWMYKFRSMKTDAEAYDGPAWSQDDDPRITRLGHFLRKFSIDEFPQFFNVLIGEMSMVGPRPERPYFVEKFEKGVPRYMERHKVKSGMTGWAQANGLRGDTSITERVQYDLYYLENWSVWFDIKIIILTFFEILSEFRR